MRESIHTPKGLAKLVHKKLEGATIPYPLPNEELLLELFQTLFFTSLKTEEGQFINLTITLINPETPDPTPPERITANRWNIVLLEEKIELSIKNLVKLSKAVDPWSSSLAVYYDKNQNLFIWGIIDQKIHHQRFLNYETEEMPDQPGLFETSIVGIGDINVIFDFQLIANLKQNTLIHNYIDVFNYGQIKSQLIYNSKLKEKEFEIFLTTKFPEVNIDDWEGEITNIMNESLCRILLKIQSYKHGGAILITPKIKSDLDVKYKVRYERLSKTISNYMKYLVENEYASDKITSDFLDPDLENLPISLYLDENVSDFLKLETSDELKGAIRFISSLSCIDGLIVFTPELIVNGFGAVIKTKQFPETVYKSKTSAINEEKLIEINSNHFGTRHRSMFSYCWNNDQSIGFVVSQDGDIRAIMRVNDKLIIWENIKVQQFTKSNKLSRLVKINKYLN